MYIWIKNMGHILKEKKTQIHLYMYIYTYIHKYTTGFVNWNGKWQNCLQIPTGRKPLQTVLTVTLYALPQHCPSP